MPTESLPIPHDQNYDKIVKTYEILHRLFFGLGIFIIVAIVGIFFAHSILIKTDTSTSRMPINIDQESVVLSGMNTALRRYENHPFIKLIIKQGKLTVNPLKMQSNNNLVTYKGFVLPKYFSTNSANSLKDMSYFYTGGTVTKYDPLELMNYMTGVIFSPIVYETDSDKKDVDFLHIEGNIIDYFGVNCLKSDKIIDAFCNTAVESMVSVLPVYDLTKDYTSLNAIATLVKDTDMSKPFCDSIKQYIYFSNNTSEQIKTILNNCGSNYAEFYNQFALFRSIQDQLDKQFINPNVANNNPLLNAYKLVSTQQFIYNELQGGKFNEIRIKSYNKYVEELLRRPTTIEPFYFDAISLFNNQYLSKELNLMMLKGSAQTAKEIKVILEELRSINGGDSTLGYDGLSKYTNLSGGIDLTSTTKIDNIVQNKTLVDIFRNQYKFENFVYKTVEQAVNPSMLTVVGTFIFYDSSTLKGRIESTLQMYAEGEKFFVSEILLPKYVFLQDNLNRILKANKYDISSLYTLMSNDGARLNTKPKSLCETIKGMEGLITCTNNAIVILKKTQEIGNIKYSIVYNNGNLSSYMISNPTLQKRALEDLGTPSTTESSLLVFIDNLIKYRPSVEVPVQNTTPTTGLAQIVQIKDDFSVLGATVNNVTKVGDLYSVEFTLKNISFIAAYDLSKQSALGMAIVSGSKKFPLKPFVLSLVDANGADVLYFSKDPKGFLLQKDPLTVKRVL